MLLTRKHVRTAVNIVIGNIAFADAIAGTIFSVNAVGRNWRNQYVFNRDYCLYITFFRDVTLNIRSFSLIVLTWERLMARMVPRIKQTSIRKAMVECLLTWIFAAVFFAYELFNYTELKNEPYTDISFTFNITYYYCTCALRRNTFNYELAMSFLTLYLPTVITVAGNLYILCKMRRASRALEGTVPTTATNDQTDQTDDVEQQVMIVIVFELTASVIACIPEQYLFIYLGYGDALYDRVSPLCSNVMTHA